MRICLIVEGSYPYIVGGVSSWTQTLISKMPEHEFIIYSIGANEKDKGKFNYKLPKNVLEVHEIFLDSILNKNGEFGHRYKIDSAKRGNIEKLILGEEFDFKEIYSLITDEKMKNISDFFMSEDFFEVVMSSYEKGYSYTPFTEFFWGVRSMLLPLFYIINNKIPEADLYHSVCTGYAGIIGGLASLVYNKPYILTEHGIYTREREEEIIKSKHIKSYFKDMWIKFYYNLSKCAYYYAKEVITLFEKNRQIEEEIGCSKEKIKVVPNGVDLDRFKNIPLKRDSDTINIGAVLRVVPIKDVKTMLESFAIVNKEIENCNFYIIGPIDEDREYYKECVKLAKSLKLKNVIFTDKVDVKEYLGRLDVMVLSSISEGQPLTILEGMACKKPQVTTDVGSCKELIYGINDIYGNAGCVVPIMNYVEMGNAIIKLCKDRELRDKLGKNGFKRVSQKYTLEKFIQSYKKIYKGYEVIE